MCSFMFAYLVGVPVSSIDSTMLVVKLNSTSDSLGKGEPGGSSYQSTKLCPNILGDMLGHQGVSGFDFWKGFTHAVCSSS